MDKPTLDALKALAENATPGPWDTDQEGDVVSWHHGTASDSPEPVPIASPLDDDEDASNPFDMLFVAATREAVPALIAEVERLRAENEALRTEADRLRRDLPNASETVG
jgi:hypothetical protein